MKKIMIVDDDEIVCKIAERILHKNYETVSVCSGAAALEQATAEKPDLILMDLNMPGMDGYEVMEQLKQCSGFDIPVVFMTSEDDIESEVKGLEMGARDYIRKPFKADILLKRIEMVIQNEENRKVLERNADADPLTGLLNRRAAAREVDNYLQGSKAHGVLLMMDIDHFKQVNDTYGHKMGDRVIMRVAEVLKSFTRAYDILGRLGGDEFVIFYKDYDNAEHLSERCNRINMRLENILNDMLGEDAEVSLSVSIGGARAPGDGADFASLYYNADKALYYVKQNGRHGFSIFSRGCESLKKARESEGTVRIDQARGMICEQAGRSGAYRVDYEDFRNIFRYIERRSEREEISAQLLLFTMQEESVQDEMKTDMMLSEFGEVAERMLRKGDVITCLGHSQYMILLTGTDTENGKMVAERIINSWKQGKENLCSPAFEIQCLVG